MGKFVEFYGPGVKALSLADRGTIANMAPEYGATCGFFLWMMTLDYLRLSGRDEATLTMCADTTKHRDCSTLQTPLTQASPIPYLWILRPSCPLWQVQRPQDRITLDNMKGAFETSLTAPVGHSGHGLGAGNTQDSISVAGTDYELSHGDVVIAAITSCTNTSNPGVMIAAVLVARARALGLTSSLGSSPHWGLALSGDRVLQQDDGRPFRHGL